RDTGGERELAVAGTVATPRGEERAVVAELLDAVGVGVDDEDVAVRVDGHARRVVELAVAATQAPPLAEERPVRVEFLDAVVVRVGDVDIPARVRRHTERRFELTVARP